MLSFLSQYFRNADLLSLLSLVAVPIVIYLISRQRYQRRRWAAMEFLLRALKRHQRKIQLQNLLLLLMRVAIIAFLVFALARPYRRSGTVALGTGGNENWVIVIDTSYSMGFQDGTTSLFDQARESVSRLSEVLFKPDDRAALVTAEERPRTVLQPVLLSQEGKQKLLGEIGELELTTAGLDLGAFFSSLDELCGKFVTPLGEPEPKRVVFLSDFQKKDWLGPDGIPSPGVEQYVEKIQKEGGEFAFAQLGGGRPRSNLAVVELSASPALIAKDVWVELRVTVRNHGEEDLENIDLTVQVDRDPDDASFEPQLGDVVRIPAGGSLTRVLPYRFTAPGYHTAVAELRSDGLLIDNRRFLTLRVSDSVKVLLVDGDPSATSVDRETFHLEAALAPEAYSAGSGQGRFTPFDPEYATVDQLNDRNFKDYSLVVLANVADVPLGLVDALKGYVRAGGAAMVFLGNNVRPEFYNTQFAQDGFLPGNLGASRGDPRYPVYLEVADATHPVTRYFEEHRETTHLERPIVAFGRYFEVSGLDPSAGGVRVAFRYTDTGRSPAVFDNSYGDGRVLWVTSTADQEWNEFSSWPDFVVFLYEAISYLVRFGASSWNLRVGDTFRRTYPSSEYADKVTLERPESPSADLRRSRNVPITMAPAAGGKDWEITHEDTEAPGLYRLDLPRLGVLRGESVEYFAVNVDTVESDLRPMTDDDFRAGLPGLKYQAFDPSERIRAVQGERELYRGSEYWKWFLYLVLALVAGETILAFLFSRRVR